MAKKLIIAEKPSVAQDIARALGGFTRQGDWFESEQYLLSSAIGHLVELAAPEEYEVKRGKWSFNHLPVIPPYFTLQPIAKTAERLALLTKLMKRKDVDGLINACDAGREGELIFRYIVQHAFGEHCPKPIQRLWLQSMTPSAIRAGFEQLRTDSEMRPLADAARCRSEADWLIGINGTRAMTAFNSQEGGFHKTTVGRVQTPTLAILVEREKRIRDFRPREYWEVEAEFLAAAGTYRGRWFDEAFTKSEDEYARPERLWEASRAEAIRQVCLGRLAEVEEERKPKSELSPLLFDLTSLQREANSRFGFSARTTLQLAQALYERHKVLTYPRTDSRYLPEDTLTMVKDVLGQLPEPFAPHAATILQSGWVQPNKRIFNDAKVSDHFAIIPTGSQAKLNEPEQKLYDLVVRRFLAVFFPAAEYHVTTRISRVQAEGKRYAFKSEGKVLITPGWLAVYGKEATQDGEHSLVPVAPGEQVQTLEIEVKAKTTQPPARFTEATLLSAMEGAGKLVEDEELRAAMSERGLGTPATRAAIIENLIAEEYVQRNGRELQPTAKAFSLIFALDKLGIDEIRSPELTGLWEWKLREMEHGRLARDEFMRQIAEQARQMVERIKKGELPEGTFGELAAPCPKCGGRVRETYKRFECAACDWKTWKVIAGRQWEPEEMSTLLRERVIGPLTGFRSKTGRAFPAIVRLNDELQPAFDFGAENDDDEVINFGDSEPLGSCPKCGGRVFEHGLAYVCENSLGADKRCDFRCGKVILQQELSRAEMAKILAEKRSSLLKGFVSNRTKKKFSAYLVLDAEGKIGFEFETRTPKASQGQRATTPEDEA